MIRAFVVLALVALSGCPKTASVPSEPAPVAAAKIDQAPIAPAAGDATAKATDGQATDAQPTDAKAASASDKASGPPPEPTLLDMMGADCRKQGGTFGAAVAALVLWHGPAGAAESEEPPAAVTAGYEKGFFIRAPGTPFELVIQGRVQARAGAARPSSTEMHVRITCQQQQFVGRQTGDPGRGASSEARQQPLAEHGLDHEQQAGTQESRERVQHGSRGR